MGAVHGVSLKYVVLSASAVCAAYALEAHDSDTAEFNVGVLRLRTSLVLFLGHASVVNGLIALLFNLRFGMCLLGKRTDNGTVPLWSYVLFAGFHLPTWLYTQLHHMKDRRFRVPVATEVEPGWWVGGRYAADLAKNWAGTVDLTCEFPEGCAATTEQYLLLRCWDGVPPLPAELEQAAVFALDARARGDVMVHCAHGRGRSTTVMCACLVKAGVYDTWEAAFDAIKSQRSVCKLNRAMRASLAAWQAEYVNQNPSCPVELKPTFVVEKHSSPLFFHFIRRVQALFKRLLMGKQK